MNAAQRDAEVVKLMLEYESPSAVRREMVVRHGVALTPGAVAGVIGRARASGLLPKLDKRPQNFVKTVEVEVAEPVEVEVAEPIADAYRPEPKKVGVDLMDLHHDQCHWPTGRRGSAKFGFGEYTYCAKPVEESGKQYCALHRKLRYVPARPRGVKATPFIHPSRLVRQTPQSE